MGSIHAKSGIMLAALAIAFAPSPVLAERSITERSVAAHEAFLASDALQGRGSATRDEAIAAAYVASEFQSYGLAPAPGMNGYLQPATIIRKKLAGPAVLTVGGARLLGSDRDRELGQAAIGAC